MPRMLLSPERLSHALAPKRFSLCRSCTTTKEIGFSRPSTIPRLFEQLRVCGQGRHGEAVYATTAISGSPTWHDDDCISIVDQDLMFTLEHDSERHWTVLSGVPDAKSWEAKLIHHADSACTTTANGYGQQLRERLEGVFSMMDQYTAAIGDLGEIFSAEYRFIDDADDGEQNRVDLWSIGRTEDWRLACHLVLRFASKLSPTPSSVLNSKLYDSAPLRTLLCLMTDQVVACRSSAP